MVVRSFGDRSGLCGERDSRAGLDYPHRSSLSGVGQPVYQTRFHCGFKRSALKQFESNCIAFCDCGENRQIYSYTTRPRTRQRQANGCCKPAPFRPRRCLNLPRPSSFAFASAFCLAYLALLCFSCDSPPHIPLNTHTLLHIQFPLSPTL